jgi:hypothetical protein
MFKLFVFYLAVLLTMTVSAYGQTYPKCKITSELYVMISDMNQPDARIFEADITALELKNEAAAEKFFAFFDDPRVSFEVDFRAQKVLVRLNDLPNEPKRSLQEWATYLKLKIQKQREQHEAFIDFRKLID